ncbi:IS982 family transposase [Rufibacter sp. XAAS-G3-1]|uniref:IS982 family transposase n=1 Tax=Rufibacter sp. XAAS-G3-1 TaxID=2729134 RepID=UPI0015E76644|nr:IS982 family transposase [Rufibacter sp. XAAS-G3-1]
MNDFTVAIYCFIDDYLQVTGRKPAAKRKLSDAEVITTALVAARFFGGNMATAASYMQQHQKCPMPHKSNFNRMLHRLSQTIAALFLALGDSLKELNTTGEYVIDSFPVAVCRNIRINRCRLLGDEAYRGYNASKREYFYGFKVEVITTAGGLPVDYFIVAGSVHDGLALQAMNVELPPQSSLYADSAYTNYEIEDLLAECGQVSLLTQRKSNSKRKDSPAMEYIKTAMRKKIETTFSEITATFPRSIHAVTPEGFLLKIVLFLFAYTINKCI